MNELINTVKKKFFYPLNYKMILKCFLNLKLHHYNTTYFYFIIIIIIFIHLLCYSLYIIVLFMVFYLQLN